MAEIRGIGGVRLRRRNRRLRRAELFAHPSAISLGQFHVDGFEHGCAAPTCDALLVVCQQLSLEGCERIVQGHVGIGMCGLLGARSIDAQGAAYQRQIDFDDERGTTTLPSGRLDYHSAADDVVVQAFEMLEAMLGPRFQRG
jgi:hypothetical protein